MLPHITFHITLDINYSLLCGTFYHNVPPFKKLVVVGYNFICLFTISLILEVSVLTEKPTYKQIVVRRQIL